MEQPLKLDPIPLVLAPADIDQIEIICPTCGKGGIWAFPEGFKIDIQGTMLVTCSNGHQWGIYRPWVEESHDD